MSKSDDLRRQRENTVINATSKEQGKSVIKALTLVEARLKVEFKISLDHKKEWKLKAVVEKLRKHFPDVGFFHHFDNSAMKPDGGILSMGDKEGSTFPILIAEVKNQGTNDRSATEGKKKQAKGNAIEHLGKNVIGFRTAMLDENITPFLCFGYGCDFEETSSILDRVVTIAMFGPLNEIQVVNAGEKGVFNRGSFFFRAKPWTTDEMAEVMYEVASRSVFHSYAKYGKERFVAASPARK